MFTLQKVEAGNDQNEQTLQIIDAANKLKEEVRLKRNHQNTQDFSSQLPSVATFGLINDLANRVITPANKLPQKRLQGVTETKIIAHKSQFTFQSKSKTEREKSIQLSDKVTESIFTVEQKKTNRGQSSDVNARQAQSYPITSITAAQQNKIRPNIQKLLDTNGGQDKTLAKQNGLYLLSNTNSSLRQSMNVISKKTDALTPSQFFQQMIHQQNRQSNQIQSPSQLSPIKAKSNSVMQNEFPCSTFFKNDENFEKSKFSQNLIVPRVIKPQISKKPIIQGLKMNGQIKQNNHVIQRRREYFQSSAELESGTGIPSNAQGGDSNNGTPRLQNNIFTQVKQHSIIPGSFLGQKGHFYSGSASNIFLSADRKKGGLQRQKYSDAGVYTSQYLNTSNVTQITHTLVTDKQLIASPQLSVIAKQQRKFERDSSVVSNQSQPRGFFQVPELTKIHDDIPLDDVAGELENEQLIIGRLGQDQFHLPIDMASNSKNIIDFRSQDMSLIQYQKTEEELIDDENPFQVKEEYYKIMQGKSSPKQNIVMKIKKPDESLQKKNLFSNEDQDKMSNQINSIKTDMDTKGSDMPIQQRERGNSFVRDGYEIFVEGIYIVNGKKKKKIRKKKLAKYMQSQDQQIVKPKLITSQLNISQAEIKSVKSVINFDQELKAIDKITEQTMALPKAKEILQAQSQKNSFTAGSDLKNNIKQLAIKPVSNLKVLNQSMINQKRMSTHCIQIKTIELNDEKINATTSQCSSINDKSKLPPKSTESPRIKIIPRHRVTLSNQSIESELPNMTDRHNIPKKLVIQRNQIQKPTQSRNKPISPINQYNKAETNVEECKLSMLISVEQHIDTSSKPKNKKIENQISEKKANQFQQEELMHTLDGIKTEAHPDYQKINVNDVNVDVDDIEIEMPPADFRDPYLQLIVSSRHLSLSEISKKFFNSSNRFILHRMVFKKMFPELLKVFKTGQIKSELLNQRDHRGNTPLLLAGKLAVDDDEFLKCVNFLFKNDCNGKLRDANGWSLIDESIGQGNARLLAISFDWLNARKKEKIDYNKKKVLERLKKIPDFYTEIHWECQSNWIPFLSKIAPSDTFQIWKMGSFIRLDFSLVGFSRLQNKRRRMSILCRDASEAKLILKSESGPKGYEDFDVVMVNKDRKIIFNPMEDLDIDEKLAVLTDIMNADPVQNELNIVSQQWDEVKNWIGNIATDNLHGYNCQRHKVTVNAQVKSKKKINQKFNFDYEKYFEGAEEIDEGELIIDEKTFKVSKDVTKVIESQLWLSQDFPLKFKQFMEVLETLSISGQPSMQKMQEFLNNDCLQQVAQEKGFPVKIQIPVALAIKATATFSQFKFLNPPNKDEFIAEIMAVPDYCNLSSRKEGMKTLTSKKKRLGMANFAV